MGEAEELVNEVKGKKSDFTEKMRGNPWIISTFVFAIIAVVFLVMSFSGGITGNAINEKDIGQQALNFFNTRLSQLPGTLDSVNEMSGIYQVIISVEGQSFPLYFTRDGNFIYQGSNLVSITGNVAANQNEEQQTQQTEVVEVDLRDAPIKGDKNALVSIVEFSDYQCPYCGKHFEQTLPLIMENYVNTGKVKLAFMDFPLDFHENAQKAAEAARCFREQKGDSGYWDYHDKLFGNQESLSLDNYKKWAKELGADENKFNSCLDSGKYEKAVKDDLSYGQSIGVSGTPAFFINGRFVSGAQPYSVFKEIIEEELNK